jgi:hypothetical protein
MTAARREVRTSPDGCRGLQQYGHMRFLGWRAVRTSSSMATDRLLERTLAALRTLRDRAVEFEAAHPTEVESVEPRFRNSARNLLHYLSIRQHDIRGLQQDLQRRGVFRPSERLVWLACEIAPGSV